MERRSVTITLHVEVDGDDLRGSATLAATPDRANGATLAATPDRANVANAARADRATNGAVAAAMPDGPDRATNGAVAAANRAAAAAHGPIAPANTGGAGGETRAFAGWLGLIGAIDALLGFPPEKGAACALGEQGATR